MAENACRDAAQGRWPQMLAMKMSIEEVQVNIQAHGDWTLHPDAPGPCKTHGPSSVDASEGLVNLPGATLRLQTLRSVRIWPS
jgi:hypothetical protein